MKYLTSSPGSSRLPENKRTLGAKLDICHGEPLKKIKKIKINAASQPRRAADRAKKKTSKKCKHDSSLLERQDRESEIGNGDRGSRTSDRGSIN